MVTLHLYSGEVVMTELPVERIQMYREDSAKSLVVANIKVMHLDTHTSFVSVRSIRSVIP